MVTNGIILNWKNLKGKGSERDWFSRKYLKIRQFSARFNQILLQVETAALTRWLQRVSGEGW